jgi:hypothetical protein
MCNVARIGATVPTMTSAAIIVDGDHNLGDDTAMVTIAA